MKRTIFLPIFLALFTVISCEKTEPQIVEEDLQGFDVQMQKEHQAIIERLSKAQDLKTELRKINEEHGRFVDEKGDVYLNIEAYREIESARKNPNQRAPTYYNSWYNPDSDGIGLVWYFDNGSYHYFASIGTSEAFLTLPSGWDLCSEYNQYFLQLSKNPNPGGSCTTNCCRNVYGRFYSGITILDEDRFSYLMTNPGVADYWYARIRNAPGVTPFRRSDYVRNGYGCGNGVGCQAGNCPGPLCGYFD